ncbi:hypothetical protein HF325_001546 [Metschnikowia pulcherrima]|uniref:assimilatory sulfite reductase (NADPH) n=1 Tax=Metschnikowia pulcherrima TaxID=27326 RepID=A0A8H7GVA4_9ASCO|nr:hypothetical protein HF325_001546 [Metschnikowia pulcherrima]
MAVSQTEAIAAVAKSQGQLFATQPTKAQASSFAQYDSSYIPLIDSNEPFAFVAQYVDENAAESKPISVATDAVTLFKNLPLLSLSAYRTQPVVVHVEIVNFDYDIVTALTDSPHTVVVSQGAADAFAAAQAAYAIAALELKAVFHFYAPAQTANFDVTNIKTPAELSSVAEILQFYNITPLLLLNNVSGAKDAVVFLGQVTPELVSAFSAEKALFLAVNVFRPLDLASLLAQIPSSVETLTFVEQSFKQSSFSPLLLEFFKNFAQHQQVKSFSKVVGAKLGHVTAATTPSAVANLLANTRAANPTQNVLFGKVAELSTKAHQQRLSAKQDGQEKAVQLEQAYTKVLAQVNDKAVVLNDFTAPTVGASNPEFGFGAFLYAQTQAKALAAAVSTAVQEKAFSSLNNEKLIELLSLWLVHYQEGKPFEQVSELVKILNTDNSPAAQRILELAAFFEIKSNWLVGSDAWAYDLGSLGVHSVISSGENINMLVIDSEPYSAKKLSARKKDIGLYAMNYGNCYVASIAIYLSYTQVLQALIEAEKFNGPSVVLAYLPYETENSDVLSILKETKSAVDTGYWPLYRYDPTIEDDTLRFQLDSSALKTQLKEFLDRENRLTLLAQKNPQLLRNLTALANSEIKKQQKQVEDESFKQLLQGLSGPPLTVAFASDGGTAEGVAKKINRQALGRGLKSVVLSMDDLSVEDLPLETNVILVSSTAGQGEIPNNGKAFWDALKQAQDLDLSAVKFSSDFLRGTIAEGLQDQSTGAICAVDQQLTKFHGIYMQDDRDIRDERKLQGLEPAYSFMVRLRLPGGFASPKQYLKLDELADTRGNETLKITTRATFQLHGVVKHNMKPAIRGMNSVLLDTLAACGDVNRNVMVSALPENARVHSQIAETGALISEYLLPQTTAYHEIWLEGADESDKPGDRDVWENRKDGPKKKKTMVAGNALVDYEPQYGPTYLPRKFKVVITVPPYNDVDVYAHDIGLIAIVQDNEVIGYNLVAGGGMGSTHNNVKTYPRTGSMMGYVAKEKVHIACENIMLVQRDNGDRTNRKHARLKYTIDDMGVDVFKKTVEEYWGEKFEEPKPFEIKSNIDYFGWVKDELNLNHFTAFIENGRIEDTPELPQKTGLKKIAEYLIENNALGEFRLTGNQHMVISNIDDEYLSAVKDLLAKYKLDNTNFSALRLSSSSCVALPTCGLAMAESERYLPELISKLEEALEEYGLRHDSVVMRMTGCPNGCARPWVAEVALVGKAMGAYNLMLGGGHHGQRLNKIYRYSIKEDEILNILKPLFKRWGLERHEGEPFGDFCIRIGVIQETTEGKYFHENIPEEA